MPSDINPQPDQRTHEASIDAPPGLRYLGSHERTTDRPQSASQIALGELQTRHAIEPGGKDGTDVESWIRSEAESLYQWAEASGWLLDPQSIACEIGELSRIGGATEHDVYVARDGGLVIKITLPPAFGTRVSIGSYVRNVLWVNELFGDDIRLIGVTRSEAGVALVISQPFIEGTPPTAGEIAAWFEGQGSVPDLFHKWRNPSNGVVIADAHTGNLVNTPAGLIPIVLQLIDKSSRPSDATLFDLMQQGMIGTGPRAANA